VLQKARAPPKALIFERYRNERRYSRPLDDSLHDAGLSMKPHRKPLVHCVVAVRVGRPRRHVDPPILHVVEPTMVLSGSAVAARQYDRFAPVNSTAGIMRSRWLPDDLRKAERGSVVFTREQVDSMQTEVL